MTKKEMFTAIMNRVADDAEMVEFLEKQIEMLEKRASAKKPTKKQLENEQFKAEILDALTAFDAPMTVSEIRENVPSIAQLTTQRISAMLSALVKDEKVVRTYIKKVAYFARA